MAYTDYIISQICDISLCESDKNDEKWCVTYGGDEYNIYYGDWFFGTINSDLSSIGVNFFYSAAKYLVLRLDITSIYVEYLNDDDFDNLYYIILNKPNLISLDIKLSCLSHDNVIKICKSLSHSNIKILTISDDDLATESITVLSEKLPKTKLKKLTVKATSMYSEDLIILVKAVAKSKLYSFTISELDVIPLENEIVDILKNNIMLQHLPMIGSIFKSLENRNKNIQYMIKKSVVTFISIRRFEKGLLNLPNEIIVIIAKYLFSTRLDSVWLISVINKI